jgi:hypothetical protein
LVDNCYFSYIAYLFYIYYVNGPKYTWNNGQEGRSFTQEHLDRAVANPEWCEKWPGVTVNVLAKRSLDHHPLLVTLLNRERKGVKKKKTVVLL